MSTSVLTEKGFAEIIAKNGGRVFRVGGCVRDSFMGVTPKDIDFSIVGMVKKDFKILFPEAEECSKSFSVFRLAIDGIKREVAFARTERKVGSGYKGIKVSTKPKITIEEDLYRRDTTVNSIALDSLTGEIIDPFHGRKDIEAKVLRATSQHFFNDPMRAVLLAGQSARFGFAIDRDTLPLMIAAAEELAHEPVDRMVAELGKVLSEAQEPGQFFKVLAKTNLLRVTFKEISDLSEGELGRVIDGLDSVAKATQNAKLRFAAFGLVLGKESLVLWNNRMTLPGDWLDAAITVSQIIGFLENPTPDKIVDTINKLRRGSLTVEEFDLIAKAAGLKIPKLGPLKAVMGLPKGEVVPKTLKGKEIGEWLREKNVKAVSKQLHFR
ncbi:MAG: tRNA cytidylyltransferase [Anaerosporomusa subterranea]|jgi:tRNA nucleotidyltransferase (CCA-adding enzyme)|nr:tRNA cytidylyltransferase [Anaerosporomusa subterranea]